MCLGFLPVWKPWDPTLGGGNQAVKLKLGIGRWIKEGAEGPGRGEGSQCPQRQQRQDVWSVLGGTHRPGCEFFGQ